MGKYLLAYLMLFGIVQSDAQVNVDFTVSAREGCGTLQVQFEDLSTSTQGAISSWRWELGAGVESDLQNPGRVYTNPGAYDICLTVTDEQGGQAKVCRTAYITVYELPKVDFTVSPANGCVPLSCTFESQVGTQGGIANMIWDIGGESGVLMGGVELATVVGEYTVPDDYTVSLTIEDINGCLASKSRPGLVQAGGISKPEVQVDNPLGCEPPHVTSFSVSGVSDEIEYIWDFGNGSSFSGGLPPPATYDEVGDFNIAIFAHDPLSGCRDTFLFPAAVRVGLQAQPMANLETGCVGSRFKFYDLSAVDGADLLWDFGDGEFSTDMEAVHRYSEPGCYEVTLTKTAGTCTVSEKLGFCVEVVERPILELAADKLASCNVPAVFDLSIAGPTVTGIQWYVGDSPDTVVASELTITTDTAGFIPFEVRGNYLPGCVLTASDTLFVGSMEIDLPTLAPLGCAPASVELIDSNANGFAITGYEWTVSTVPPQTSSEARPTIAIDSAGTFDVQLIATSTDGCIDTVEVQSYIRAGTIPTLEISSDITSTCSDTTIYFTLQGQPAVDEAFWLFGDGGESYELNPGHVYGDTGVFTIVVQAGNNGCFASDSLVDHIEIFAPVSSFEMTVPCGSDELHITDKSIGADLVRYELTQDGNVLASSDERDPILSPIGSGRYELIQYTWNTSSGCQDEHRDSVILESIELEVSFEPQAGCAPIEVKVRNTTPGITSWEWRVPGAKVFGDTLAEPVLRFKKPGVYEEFRVKVTDQFGCEQTIFLDEKVLVGAIVPELGDPYLACPGTELTLEDYTASEIPIVSWEWSVGPGLFFSNDPQPVITTDIAGYFTLGLSITDSLGCSAEMVLDSFIHVLEPNLSFTGDTLTCVDVASAFAVTNPEPGIVYNWSFGDGNFATGREVEHSFETDGVYDVCVSIEIDGSCDTVQCHKVQVGQANAAFAVDTNYASCPPLLVHFDNQSTGAVDFTWSFGDSSGASPLTDPGHVYTEPGVFDILLIARRSALCADTLLVPDMIELEGPEGGFSYSTDGECLPVEVLFTGLSDEPYDYIWDFGNGVIDSSEGRVITDTATHLYNSPGSFLPSLILIDTDNCKRSFEGVDSILVRDAIVDAGRDTVICRGQSVDLDPQLSSGMAWWDPNPVLQDTTLLVQTVWPDSSMQFVLRGIDGACDIVDSFQVDVLEHVSVFASDHIICVGDTVELAGDGNADVFEWQAADGLPLYVGPDPLAVVAPEMTDTYRLIGTRSTCTPDTAYVAVEVRGNFEYQLLDEYVVYPGETFTVPLTIADGQQVTVQWSPANDLSCTSCTSPVIHIDSNAVLFLQLTDPVLGCSIADTVLLRVPDECSGAFAYVPNVFSPNGDGVNDVLQIHSRKYNELASFSVFDRWGNQVYRTSDIGFAWDGTVDGEYLLPGVYVFSMHLVCPIDGSSVYRSGDITVVR